MRVKHLQDLLEPQQGRKCEVSPGELYLHRANDRNANDGRNLWRSLGTYISSEVRLKLNHEYISIDGNIPTFKKQLINEGLYKYKSQLLRKNRQMTGWMTVTGWCLCSLFFLNIIQYCKVRNIVYFIDILNIILSLYSDFLLCKVVKLGCVR